MLDDPNPVTDAAVIALVVRKEARIMTNVLLISLVLYQPFHPHNDSLVQLVADYGPHQSSPAASLTHFSASRCSLSTVATRAISRRSDFNFAVSSSWPVECFTFALKY